MGTTVISQNVTLDGIVEDPTGDDGFRHGGWLGQIGDQDREAWAKVGFEEALRTQALSYEVVMTDR